MTRKSLPPSRACSRSRVGISWRHGTHHVARTFNRSTRASEIGERQVMALVVLNAQLGDRARLLKRLATVHTPEGMPLPPNTLAELQRDMARLGFVVSQIREIEEARQKR